MSFHESVLNITNDAVGSVVNSIDFYDLILPLLGYTLALVLYATFIWKFYKFMSKRDIITLNLQKAAESRHPTLRTIISTFGFIIEYLIVFPVLIFIWFAVLSGFLFILSKTQSVELILLLSMTLVASVRALSYYKEEIAAEVAKILPIAVLAIFIVDPTFFSINLAFERISEVPSLTNILVNYLLFAITLEFALRLLTGLKRAITELNTRSGV